MAKLQFSNAPQRREFLDLDSRNIVISYVISGIFWLILGSILAILASLKLHWPQFLDGASYLTFGRVRPLHLNTMVYGWASMTGSGVALWVLMRTLRVTIPYKGALFVSVIVWNISLVVGSIQLLAGVTHGLEWLEIPLSSASGMLLSILIITFVVLMMLFNRATKSLYISVYYIIAAFLWIPALLLVAYIPNYSSPIEAGMNWWYAHNALGLWFTPICLAAAYFFIPKVTGRPIYSYWLSLLGFWSLAIFYNWNGFHHLIGGPVPTWAITISISASIMMIIPVVTVAVNHHLTVVGAFRRVINSPTLRFVVFGAMSYTLVSLQGSFQAIRSFNEIIHFTHYVVAHAHIGMYAFVTMVLFGSIYYIFPRILKWEWHSKKLIKLHFWSTAIGIILYVVALQIGGIHQGILMNNPDIPFIDIVNKMIPYLQSRSVAGTLMTIGHFIFAYLIFRMVWEKATSSNEVPPEPVVTISSANQ